MSFVQVPGSSSSMECRKISCTRSHVKWENPDGFQGTKWGEDVWFPLFVKASDLDYECERTSSPSPSVEFVPQTKRTAFVGILALLKTLLMCYPCRSSYNGFFEMKPPDSRYSLFRYMFDLKNTVNQKLNRPRFPLCEALNSHMKHVLETANEKMLVTARWYYCFISLLYMIALNHPFQLDWRNQRHAEMFRDFDRFVILSSDFIPSQATIFKKAYIDALQHTTSRWTTYFDEMEKLKNLSIIETPKLAETLDLKTDFSSLIDQRRKLIQQHYYFLHRNEAFHFIFDLERQVILQLSRESTHNQSAFGRDCVEVQRYFETIYRAQK